MWQVAQFYFRKVPYVCPQKGNLYLNVGFDHGLPCRVKNMARGPE